MILHGERLYGILYFQKDIHYIVLVMNQIELRECANAWARPREASRSPRLHHSAFQANVCHAGGRDCFVLLTLFMCNDEENFQRKLTSTAELNKARVPGLCDSLGVGDSPLEGMSLSGLSPRENNPKT